MRFTANAGNKLVYSHTAIYGGDKIQLTLFAYKVKIFHKKPSLRSISDQIWLYE